MNVGILQTRYYEFPFSVNYSRVWRYNAWVASANLSETISLDDNSRILHRRTAVAIDQSSSADNHRLLRVRAGRPQERRSQDQLTPLDRSHRYLLKVLEN